MKSKMKSVRFQKLNTNTMEVIVGGSFCNSSLQGVVAGFCIAGIWVPWLGAGCTLYGLGYGLYCNS